MQALFKEIRITVSQEAQIVKAVFPDPSAVMKVFIQRVFAQVVRLHLAGRPYQSSCKRRSNNTSKHWFREPLPYLPLHSSVSSI